MLSRVYRLIFLAGLAVQPLIYSELARVEWIQRWIEAVVVLGLTAFVSQPKKQKISLIVVILPLLFLLATVSSSLINGVWPHSLWGNYWRGDGLLTLIHFIALLLILKLMPIRPSEILRAIGAGSLLLSLWVLWENIRLLIGHQAVPNWHGVIGVSFNQPVFLAGYLAVTLPAVSGFWRIIPVLAIILTRVWGGYLGIFLLAARKTPRLAGGLILLVMLAALVGKIGHYLESGLWAKNAEARERIVMKGLLAWKQKPLLGWGWANFVYVDKAHSGLLEVLVTTGIVGFGFYLAIIGLMLKRLSGNFLLMLVIWLVHSQTNVISISEELLFWILLGVANERA